MEKNPLIMASAFKKAKAIKNRIKELDILDPQFNKSIILDTLVQDKLQKNDKKLSLEKIIEGQEWYLDHLISFSQLNAQALLDNCYEEAFESSASEAEMVAMLSAL